MKKLFSSQMLPTIILAAIVCLFIECAYFRIYPPATALKFQQMSWPVLGGLIGTLFAVALFIERAVEVIVMVFRDEDAELMDNEEARATAACDAVAKTLTDMGTATNPPADQTAKDRVAAAVLKSRSTLEEIQDRKLRYRAQTKQLAAFTGFILGALVSLAGVHSLGGLLALDSAGRPLTNPGRMFNLADLIVTSAMLAGGSEGIHRMANVFTSVMDNLSTRADQGQNKPGAPPPATPKAPS